MAGRPPKTKIEDNTLEDKINENIKDETIENGKSDETKKIVKVLPNHVEINIKSNYNGKLYFENPRTGNVVTWSRFGDVEQLSVEDIKYMKSNSRGFFEKNWIKIIGVNDEEYQNLDIEELYHLLSLNKFYKIKELTDDFENYLCLTKAEIEYKLDSLSQKEKELFKNYVLSLNESKIEKISNGVVKLLNKKLGIEL